MSAPISGHEQTATALHETYELLRAAAQRSRDETPQTSKDDARQPAIAMGAVSTEADDADHRTSS